jgi:hypothetical protein
MSFTTKVKSTGQLFDATGETGEDGILHDATPPLRSGTKYSGHLLEGAYPGNSPWVEFSTAVWAVFEGDELEEWPVEMRLVPFR